jgi:tRNA G18 (ribose-2'-O)-methylase SpoU
MNNDQPIGVPPHPQPWPTDDRYDPVLLAEGDRRNVEDNYRYWKVEAIVADLDATRAGVHVAIENWQHDMNIGTIVRNANAFNVAAVHVIGKRHWNRRGAMATEKYLHVFHHATVADFVQTVQGKHIIAIDNQAGAKELHEAELPENAVLVFGGEGPGVSAEMIAASEYMVAIEQFGSTRSVNVGVASGVVLYEWTRRHRLPSVKLT